MKALFILTLFSSITIADDYVPFIVDSGVQIKEGFANTSDHYISYDIKKFDLPLRFKKRKCFKGKIKKFSKTFKKLEKKGYEYTISEAFVNNIPGSQKQVATFLITFVKDNYTGDWLDQKASDDADNFPKDKPANHLVYKSVHFECPLKANKGMYDGARSNGKNIPLNNAVYPKSKGSKSMQE